MSLSNEIKRRRTFGIISHPDAGKTTLTEKLLLFGGAINTAGAVKAKKASRHATSDFMEIEKQRGISVATSVMGFDYKGFKINLLDTPGHEDFCEDTYRTLTAVDSAIMVIDAVKGVEAQTYKLLDVCRMRKTPVMTFINKLDRDGKEPIELLDEIEDRLSMPVCPMSWPVGAGRQFKGVYSIYEKRLILFNPHGKQDDDHVNILDNLDSSSLDDAIGATDAQQLRDDIDLITGVYPSFDISQFLSGNITPVLFGSALNNFGVRELLDCFINYAPSPLFRESDCGTITPDSKEFSGFIFKIHANIDPKHRDRIAFLRICSGEFQRNRRVTNVRTKKAIRPSNPTAFMAQSKDIIDVAYPGDIIGLHDTGNLRIGDTLTLGSLFRYKGIPSFSPEIFKRMINLDPLKTKQLHKGIEQLCEEGVAQVFTRYQLSERLVGTVGALQFDVIQYRLENEYGASCRFEPVPFIKACWLESDSKDDLNLFIRSRSSQIAIDAQHRYVFLSETQWSLDREIKEWPNIRFLFSSDQA